MIFLQIVLTTVYPKCSLQNGHARLPNSLILLSNLRCQRSLHCMLRLDVVFHTSFVWTRCRYFKCLSCVASSVMNRHWWNVFAACNSPSGQPTLQSDVTSLARLLMGRTLWRDKHPPRAMHKYSAAVPFPLASCSLFRWKDKLEVSDVHRLGLPRSRRSDRLRSPWHHSRFSGWPVQSTNCFLHFDGFYLSVCVGFPALV